MNVLGNIFIYLYSNTSNEHLPDEKGVKMQTLKC